MHSDFVLGKLAAAIANLARKHADPERAAAGHLVLKFTANEIAREFNPDFRTSARLLVGRILSDPRSRAAIAALIRADGFALVDYRRAGPAHHRRQTLIMHRVAAPPALREAAR